MAVIKISLDTRWPGETIVKTYLNSDPWPKVNIEAGEDRRGGLKYLAEFKDSEIALSNASSILIWIMLQVYYLVRKYRFTHRKKINNQITPTQKH